MVIIIACFVLVYVRFETLCLLRALFSYPTFFSCIFFPLASHVINSGGPMFFFLLTFCSHLETPGIFYGIWWITVNLSAILAIPIYQQRLRSQTKLLRNAHIGNFRHKRDINENRKYLIALNQDEGYIEQ